MKKIALLAAVLATVSVGACSSYHQAHKMNDGKSTEAAARAAVYGSADKTSKVK